MPLIEHLKVNYRTHSGILEVASSVVDALRRFFPQHIDALERERAFFQGPKPLLLSTVTTDDLAILLSWSDQADSQVEFGAHQVVLVRSMDSVDRLPPGLRDSNALVLTVPQAKGLEFDGARSRRLPGPTPAEALLPAPGCLPCRQRAALCSVPGSAPHLPLPLSMQSPAGAHCVLCCTVPYCSVVLYRIRVPGQLLLRVAGQG
jgi:hypothetical protein